MSASDFPKLVGKHRMKPLLTPDVLVASLKKKVGDVPRRAVFIYLEHLTPKFVERLHLVVHADLTRFLFNPKRTYITDREDLLVSVLPIGAPTTAIVAEELGALGVSEFLLLGTAGGLSPTLSTGDIVLCTKAVRDEGTSHHYLADSLYSTPSPELTGKLRIIIEKLGLRYRAGPTWTTDAPYMETAGEVTHYRKAGVLTVEMEASGLFAVAKKRGYKAGAVFVISDLLGENGWSGFAKDLDRSYSQLPRIAQSFAKLD